jgi:hypothetical protein
MSLEELDKQILGIEREKEKLAQDHLYQRIVLCLESIVDWDNEVRSKFPAARMIDRSRTMAMELINELKEKVKP